MNRKLLKRHWNWLIDLIFPGFCPICEESSFLDGDHYTCLECLDKIAWISGARCKLCGISMAGIDFQGLFCSSCRENDFSFDEGRCMFALDQCGRKLIHELKYRGARDVIRDFSAWKERVPDFLPFLENSILVPVPLHSRRMRSRGYNQSLWIAQAMVKEVGENSELSDCLKRIRNTRTQTKNDREERKKNVRGAFVLKPGFSLKRKKRIVLVDDVFTTGATLDACAQILRKEGFRRIAVATLGHG